MDPETFDRLVEEIQAVTVEDVQEVAREYLHPDSFHILVVGNGGELGGELERFGEVNLLDISIPEPGEAEGRETGDAAAAAEWLNKMAGALLSEGKIDSKLNVEVETRSV